ncbi:hypothetical protein [Xanthovirga aplysinae]|uniref:hypothetical protein n=1 Tax=Xanthovirga aplysinae TaxID=2529853 RepID=UPI0012BC9ED9|nr:hypothetical protein [Xanthovirga aplysinae]MTI30656.1 hypothetical protein [Xanthovirga aplysinae]
MDKLGKKRKILEEVKRRQQEIIDKIQENINVLRESQGNINEEEYDLQLSSYNDETSRNISSLANSLNIANDGFDLLNKIIVKEKHSKISFGSFVRTNQGIFFIGVSQEPFQHNGMKITGLSQESSLFKKMEGLSSGEQFLHQGISYTIEEVI